MLALASAKRVSELHALSVSELCMRWLPDDSGVVLRPNPSFLPKVLLPQFINVNQFGCFSVWIPI